ncbi:MAG TPA: amidinotransferase, partial [Flavobacteriales bacterium]|nr:amidinotransferase [Flavobacteriales bacterium]
DHPEDQVLVKSNLEADGLAVVELSEDQINQFAGNMLEVKGSDGQTLIVMSRRAHQSLDADQRALLETFGTIVSPDLDVIETCGGGSARCMMAEVHLPQPTHA